MKTRSDIESTVLAALAAVLKCPVPDGAATTREGLPAWDSLKHVEIMFVLEDEFGVEFSEDELSRLDGVAAIVDAVVARQHAA